jgi:hypothetical protein
MIALTATPAVAQSLDFARALGELGQMRLDLEERRKALIPACKALPSTSSDGNACLAVLDWDIAAMQSADTLEDFFIARSNYVSPQMQAQFTSDFISRRLQHARDLIPVWLNGTTGLVPLIENRRVRVLASEVADLLRQYPDILRRLR